MLPLPEIELPEENLDDDDKALSTVLNPGRYLSALWH